MAGLKVDKFIDPTNVKIQKSFDLVFKNNSEKAAKSYENSENQEMNNFQLNMDNPMSSNNNPKILLEENNDLKLDFDSGYDETEIGSSNEKTLSSLDLSKSDDNELDFTLDFNHYFEDVPAIPQKELEEDLSSFDHTEMAVLKNTDELNSHLSSNNIFNLELSDSDEDFTQKTIVFENKNESQMEAIEPAHLVNKMNSTESITSEEAKVNIEITIKDILKPRASGNTQDIDLSEMNEVDDLSGLSFDSEGSNNPGFDLTQVDFSEKELPKDKIKKEVESSLVFKAIKESEVSSQVRLAQNSLIDNEDSIRVHATIRQLIEEREDLLSQIKKSKLMNRELEQDNLTLRASLDESKIEVSILRKRHLVELNDIKYQLSLNEEKKAIAEERARQFEAKREKLEQRVRIDFNQVKLREKELESKLEMQAIDIDSQVQSRDHKILELRRKIDSLEFNMENVSIKEHKSQDDKRKLEDKLNKMMKTLRHSIKNLEDDIETEEDELSVENEVDLHRTGKA